jgi:hypothetical protein
VRGSLGVGTISHYTWDVINEFPINVYVHTSGSDVFKTYTDISNSAKHRLERGSNGAMHF